eukprot:TRINITY_DN7345_c0_g1_i1.p1 TRINITY_DN7345_c0_g1~~TRINITY_DN7345_c0_g1_i1.p1  ORF type:complete len:438 (-),score=55.88 TRINITY_DN7345_c0_g1_i1:93-1406(-)
MSSHRVVAMAAFLAESLLWLSFIAESGRVDLFGVPSMKDVQDARTAALSGIFDGWTKTNKQCFEAPPDSKGCKETSLKATRKLFDDVNKNLVSWEAPTNRAAKLRCPGEPTAFDMSKWPEDTLDPDVSIVYGGMPPSKALRKGEHWQQRTYHSMPTAIIAALQSLSNSQVISLSRRVADEVPPGHKHISLGRRGLLGDSLLPSDVLANLTGKTVRVYVTYANHHPDPKVSIENIEVAKKVAADVLKIKAKARSVHIVLTGTDATNHPEDDSRKYKVGGPNFHYAMSKIAQAYVLEDALTPTATAKRTVARILKALESLGNIEDKNSGAYALANFHKELPTVSDGRQAKGLLQFASDICATYQGFRTKAYEFKTTSIIQIGVMLTDLHVQRKAMQSAADLELPFKGVKWIRGALPVIISPQYAAYKHFTVTPGLIGTD